MTSHVHIISFTHGYRILLLLWLGCFADDGTGDEGRYCWMAWADPIVRWLGWLTVETAWANDYAIRAGCGINPPTRLDELP